MALFFCRKKGDSDGVKKLLNHKLFSISLKQRREQIGYKNSSFF
ncbi:hypothetical protein B4129_2889 [Bacillus safensis]|nr:hypothetical protein B4129_2889 [Bacillus safensis]